MKQLKVTPRLPHGLRKRMTKEGQRPQHESGLMTIPPRYFYLPDGADPEPFMASLALPGKLRHEPPRQLLRTYHDTFDWRLHAAGGLLIEEQESGRVCTSWRRITDQHLLGHFMTAVPRHPLELPDGPVRDSLVKLTEMRALLPVAGLHVRIHRAALLNKTRKTVLRLMIEAGTADTTEASQGRSLPARLCLEAVKGYPKPFLLACKRVQDQLGLRPAEPQLEELLALHGRKPQDYSSKLEVELQAAMPAGEALRTILRHLLQTMERNLEGARQDLDSEFLHDFRVAVRRTRSLLSQVKGVLPADVANPLRAEFKWLGQITGATRDLDVYLLKLPGYRARLPAALQGDLQPLQDYLVRHRQQEQRKLARQLVSARCRRLLCAWREFLETPMEALSWPLKASRPILEIANRRTWKTYRLVLEEVLAIGDDSPAAVLHELRINCKKLRYLMEFFQSLHPAEMIGKQIKALKGLQDNLGDFHDLEIQADALREFAHAMQAEQVDLPGETLMAMGVLIDSLRQRQDIERRDFAERFARFAGSGNRKVCRKLFKPVLSTKEPL